MGHRLYGLGDDIMGKTLHNTIHLGRKGVFASRRLIGAAAAVALAALALGMVALR